MIKEIIDEVSKIIKDSFVTIANEDYVSYILYIGRAEFIPDLVVGSCIDYQIDHYHDETREAFYIRYLIRNYSKEGFKYDGASGIDDLSIEMMIYCHLWDSVYFLKSLYRLSCILCGNGYQWTLDIPENGKYDFIKNDIIKPLQQSGLALGYIVDKAFDSNIRNAFAHSLYNVNVESGEIYTRTKLGNKTYTFEEFQSRFIYSVVLMNKLQNYLELSHNDVAANNTITEPFLTPNDMMVQVYANMIERSGQLYPKFRLIRVNEPKF